MEKEPKFIKEFSKEESTEERQEIAQEIRAKRAEYFGKKETPDIEKISGTKESRIERQTKLRESIGERDAELAEQLKSMQELGNKIEELSSSGLSKLLHYFKLKKTRADIAVGEQSYEELKKQQETAVSEEEIQTAEVETPPELQEAKEMVDNFYKEQKKKWTKSEYTKEDITKNFSEEHLASLSLDDYVTLLKRFPSEMVTHVTRQGVRDHTKILEHQTGIGNYHDGFMKILEDGRLRSTLGINLIEGVKKDAVAKVLQLDRFQSKEEAIKYLEDLTNKELGFDNKYADRMAIHLATGEVADAFYGAETGNEIFIAFPSAHVASQYYFSGQLTKRDWGAWNDQWVWANEERGMDLDVGIVFIPEETRVDSKNGSRYELNEDRSPIINYQYIDLVTKIADDHGFQKIIQKANEVRLNFHNKGRRSEQTKNLSDMLKPFYKQLEDEFGVTDQRLKESLLDDLNFYILKNKSENFAEKILKDQGILYREAEKTISAKEFWENYFKKHPDQRLSKVVYYKGGDPTVALQQWKGTHGLWKEAKEQDIGFQERNVSRKSPQATAGMDRFRSIAEKAIEEHFD